MLSDGSQPVGRGIGPALEARDGLAVLRREPGAPQDLAGRAIALAGALLELAGAAAPGTGLAAAAEALVGGVDEARRNSVKSIRPNEILARQRGMERNYRARP